jgi:hypothetical protein
MQVVNDAKPPQARIVYIRSAGTPDEPVNLIPLLEQQL